MNNKAYYNSSGKKVLEYVSSDTVTLDLPFILTKGKQLTVNMPYMKLEKFLADTHVAAVRLLGVEDKNGVVHLNVQELESGVTYTLSYNLEFNGEWWLWSLADMDSLFNR
jgi:hypothetical protein